MILKSAIFWDIMLWQAEPVLATCFHAGFLFGVFFGPEDGGNMFLRNVGWLSTVYMAYPMA
jgi:hypothetical protein